jgi:hypothetical protein
VLGQRLLDDTCRQRTGIHEDDGCWPSFAQSPRPRSAHLIMGVRRRGNTTRSPSLEATARPKAETMLQQGGPRPAATLLQLGWQPRHPRTEP